VGTSSISPKSNEENVASGCAECARLRFINADLLETVRAIKAITQDEANPKREQRLTRIYELCLEALARQEGRA